MLEATAFLVPESAPLQQFKGFNNRYYKIWLLLRFLLKMVETLMMCGFSQYLLVPGATR